MAKSKKATTRGVNLPVPQSREEAEALLQRIGEDQRELARIEAGLAAQTAALKAAAEAEAKPVKERLTAAMEGLKTWAEANRQLLTGGKSKSAELATGVIGWRLRPASVSLRNVEGIMAAIKAAPKRFGTFLRIKTEVDKEAMLKAPDLAREIPGVSIGSEGEVFYVEPTGATLAPAAPVGEAA